MGSRRPRTKWRPEDDQTLITQLLDCKANGLQADSGWKGTAWSRCEEALVNSELVSGGAFKSADTCQTRWQKVSPLFTHWLVICHKMICNIIYLVKP